MRNINKLVGTTAVTAVVLAIATTGGAVAGSLITSKQIENDSIRSVDLKNGGAVALKDLKPGLRNAVTRTGGTDGKDGKDGKDGAVGATGPAGPTGAVGATGPAGAPGKDAVTNVQVFLTPLTDVVPGFPLNVVPVPFSPKNGTNDGDTTLLEFELDAGKYLIDGDAQFFHFVPGGPDTEDFGVISLLVEGSDERGTSFTADIPEDGNNGAQTSASTYVEIPEDDTTVTVVGSIRGSEDGHAGAQVRVTKVG